MADHTRTCTGPAGLQPVTAGSLGVDRESPRQESPTGGHVQLNILLNAVRSDGLGQPAAKD